MNLFVDIVISLAIALIIAGAWLSMPAGVPFAPSQRFIDALPTWLQGPRRIVPKVKDEPWPPAQHDEPVDEHNADTQYHLSVPPKAPENTEPHEEAAPHEIIHDEP